MKEKILKLRSKGKSYNQIKKILGCSKSTISFHCGEGQKEKSLIRSRSNRKKTSNIIRKKISRFLTVRIRHFKKRDYYTTKSKFSYDSAYKKIYKNPFCYLTGEKIDLSLPSTYQLDHIKPFSKGGKNTLRNMGLLLKEVNYAKGDLSVDEFIKLCKKVCEHNGYKVIRNKKQ